MLRGPGAESVEGRHPSSVDGGGVEGDRGGGGGRGGGRRRGGEGGGHDEVDEDPAVELARLREEVADLRGRLARDTDARAAKRRHVANAVAATSMLTALLPGVPRSRRDAVYEDRVLRRLREAGLISYPSPLLLRLLEELPEVLAAEVLSRLDPVDLVLFGQAGRACWAAVLASGLPRVPQFLVEGAARLRLADFCTSVDRLAWANRNGCTWDAGSSYYNGPGQNPCALAARGGHLEVLKWAREQGCPWLRKHSICYDAAGGGHLDVLKWARAHNFRWNAQLCALAAEGGHLQVLMWARANGCPWDPRITCSRAAAGTWRC